MKTGGSALLQAGVLLYFADIVRYIYGDQKKGSLLFA
jgi:hypothetical protein